MKKIVNLLFLSVMSSVAFSAEKAPIGSWQLSTSTQLEVTTPAGKKVKSTPLNGYEFATFQKDGSYVSSEWLNKLLVVTGSSGDKPKYIPLDFYGQWYSRTSSTYSVTFDKFLIFYQDDKFGITNINFFDRIGFLQFVTANFGVISSPSVQVISYSDDGNVSSKSLKGTKKIVIGLTGKKGEEPITTNVTVTETYTGKPFVQSTCCGTDVAQNAIDSDKFIKDVSIPAVKTTASGLKYVVLQDNPNGATPTAPTDTVTVNYRGFLPSGKMFDSNSSISFPLNGVIPGWTEGLQLMKKGAKYRFFIPSDLAYGQAGNPTIPGNSALIFDVELLAITPAASPSTTTPTPTP